MKNIGIIDKARLSNIPEERQPAHEFCFHLHDLMAHLLAEIEVQRAHHCSFKIETEEDEALLQSDVHILDFLAQSGRGAIERRAVINHMTVALYADMLHFIYEGMIALEKRKFAVAFALFRKPFKEGLLLAAQMCADEVIFFDKIKTDAKNLLNRKFLDEPKIKDLLTKALAACRDTSIATSEMIYNMAFDRSNANGLAPLFDKATHLTTEFSQIQTEDYNVNFIFKNPEDNDVYDNIYPQLSILLLTLNIMQIELYRRMENSREKYRSWISFISIGAYEALFLSKEPKMTQFVNSTFKDFLVCPDCSADIRVEKMSAPRLFIAEILDCAACGMSHHFPLKWLLSKVEPDPSGC